MPFSGAAFPPAAIIKIKLKVGEEWYDTLGLRVVSLTSNLVRNSLTSSSVYAVLIAFVCWQKL